MARASRQTKQKEAICKEMAAFDTLFSADELFERVRSKHPDIGIATIYRFLRDAKEDNLLHAYTCDRRMLYSKEHNNHCHFVCHVCNKITHFTIDNVQFIKSKIKGNICHFQVDASGVCEKCRK